MSDESYPKLTSRVAFNINQRVQVKLTARGESILNSEGYRAKPDENGYHTFQLWKLMKIFGDSILISFDGSPFDTNIILLPE